MDPISAISVTSSIVTFVDFACKLVAGSHAIAQSASGLSANGRTLDVVAKDFSQLTDNLRVSLAAPEISNCPPNPDLAALVEECAKVADSLGAAIERLRASGSKKRWASFKAALREIWSKDLIETLSAQLTMLQSQLNTRLLSEMRTDQSAIQQTLTRLEQQNQLLEMEQTEQLRDLEANIVSAVTQLRDRAPMHHQLQMHQDSVHTYSNKAALSRGLGDIPLAFSEFAAEGRRIALQQSILTSLRFRMMEVRHAKVAAAHAHTFEWMFSDGQAAKRSIFVDWLESGTDVFWIFGKPGSGKSTLMKYICQDDRLSEHLHIWAGSSKLVVAKFYFWNAGTTLQKSLTGLLRSLLFEILREVPELILRIPMLQDMPVAGEGHQGWHSYELEKALRLVIQQTELPARFCFLIDGLDEYERSPETGIPELISLLGELSASKNIKLCVSSRPWNIFRDAYGRNPNLKLEDLTRNDIRVYVRDKFESHHVFQQHQALDTRYSDLIEQVAAKAQGVFLWVYLVVRSVLEGFTNGDDISRLQQRVDRFPSDLEEFFKHILDTVDPFYKQQTLNTLSLVLHASEPPTLAMYSFLNDADLPKPNFDVAKNPGWVGESRQLSELRMDAAQRRLDAQCKGLIEVVPSKGIFLSCCKGCNSKVDLLHRTVRDFLLNPQLPICSELASNTNFNLDIFLFKATFAQFQLMTGSVPVHNFEQCRPFLWNLVDYAMPFDKQSANDSQEYVALLDQARALLARVLASDRSQPISSAHRQDASYLFVHLADQRGLKNYVRRNKAHLKHDGLSIAFADASTACSEDSSGGPLEDGRVILGEPFDGMNGKTPELREISRKLLAGAKKNGAHSMGPHNKHSKPLPPLPQQAYPDSPSARADVSDGHRHRLGAKYKTLLRRFGAG